jgi:hypothetical protein
VHVSYIIPVLFVLLENKMKSDTFTTGNMNDNDAETEKNWKKLRDAISEGDVSTVGKLLTLHPELAYYREQDVSPANDTHGYRQI